MVSQARGLLVGRAGQEGSAAGMQANCGRRSLDPTRPPPIQPTTAATLRRQVRGGCGIPPEATSTCSTVAAGVLHSLERELVVGRAGQEGSTARTILPKLGQTVRSCSLSPFPLPCPLTLHHSVLSMVSPTQRSPAITVRQGLQRPASRTAGTCVQALDI